MTSFATDEKVLPAIKASARAICSRNPRTTSCRRFARLSAASRRAAVVAHKVLLEIAHPSRSPANARTADRARSGVLNLVAGMSNQDIAEDCISAATVRTHISSIMGKLYVANRVQAAHCMPCERGWQPWMRPRTAVGKTANGFVSTRRGLCKDVREQTNQQTLGAGTWHLVGRGLARRA